MSNLTCGSGEKCKWVVVSIIGFKYWCEILVRNSDQQYWWEKVLISDSSAMFTCQPCPLFHVLDVTGVTGEKYQWVALDLSTDVKYWQEILIKSIGEERCSWQFCNVHMSVVPCPCVRRPCWCQEALACATALIKRWRQRLSMLTAN